MENLQSGSTLSLFTCYACQSGNTNQEQLLQVFYVKNRLNLL